MDEPRDIPEAPDSNPSEPLNEAASAEASAPFAEIPVVEVFPVRAGEPWPASAALPEEVILRQRNFRRNLWAALALALVAFTLTSWILVRVDSPFGMFAT